MLNQIMKHKTKIIIVIVIITILINEQMIRKDYFILFINIINIIFLCFMKWLSILLFTKEFEMYVNSKLK